MPVNDWLFLQICDFHSVLLIQKENFFKHRLLMEQPLEFEKSEIKGSLSARFDRASALLPAHPAVKSEKYDWSYSFLREKANQIAQAIIGGYGTETEPIALLMDHDAPLIACMIGVMKAGKFYAVLDPSYPKYYLTEILTDLGTRLLVCDAHNLPLAEGVVQSGCGLIVYEDISEPLPNGRPTGQPVGAYAACGLFYLWLNW